MNGMVQGSRASLQGGGRGGDDCNTHTTLLTSGPCTQVVNVISVVHQVLHTLHLCWQSATLPGLEEAELCTKLPAHIAGGDLKRKGDREVSK